VTEEPGRGRSGTPGLSLRLYVAGDAPNSATALFNLRIALAQLALVNVELEVVDVLREPARGLLDGVLVTPTLLRVAPLPERRVVGNLREQAALLSVLSPVDYRP
jgi:circadian clock protein KaiB